MERQSSKAIAKTKLVLLRDKDVNLQLEAESLWNEHPSFSYYFVVQDASSVVTKPGSCGTICSLSCMAWEYA